MAQDDDDSPYENSDKVAIAVEECWCGAVTFYISKDRRVFCAECENRIDNTVVFTSDSLAERN